MKIAVIGAGASGILYAIMRKRSFPQDEIIIIEKEKQIGKKIYATGNGKCNIFNGNSGNHLFQQYRQPKIAQEVFQQISAEDLKRLFEDLGLDLKKEDDRYYPRTESAKTVMDIFKFWLKEYQITLKLGTTICDYDYEKQKLNLILDDGKMMVDRLVIATGGYSSPHLGSDGSFFDIVKKHHYHIGPCLPGLVAIKVKEDISPLDGLRYKALVTLLADQQPVFQEKGEIQFKKDGLGGIAMMNASLIIARNYDSQTSYTISLDLFPEESEEELYQRFMKKIQNGYPYLDGSLITPIARYVEQLTQTRGKKSPKEVRKVVRKVKNLSFDYQDLFSFSHSQVTVGGISLCDIDSDFQSKKESNVFFIGEILDNDAPCGGYNLMWAWASAIIAARKP